MPFARPNQTRWTPRPVPRRPRRAVVTAGPSNPVATWLQTAPPWNFALRVWIAFDGPTAAAPQWIDISGFVDTKVALRISHGRSDGLADVNASTVALTVDNSDGRFAPLNPAGAWFGQIRKGSWLKVEILPPSGVVSTRFVGFITTLPTGWSGQYASSQITASDRYEKLANIPTIPSMIQSEVMSDPNLSGNVKAYWNLHEGTGSLTFGDTSGNGSSPLTAAGSGGSAGLGFAASNAAAPGFDSLRCPTFSPASASQGTYLTAPVTMPTGVWSGPTSYVGLFGTVEFWMQATTTGVQQNLMAFVDPTGQVSAQVSMGASGYLLMSVNGTSAANPSQNVLTDYALSGTQPLNDGRWHQIVFGAAGTFTFTGAVVYMVLIDAINQGFVGGASGLANMAAFSGFTRLVVGGGYSAAGLSLGAANISDVAFVWSDFGTFSFDPTRRTPNLFDHYFAGATGLAGESTDKRIARIARYAGIPIPLTTGPTVVEGKARIYNPSTGPWTNLLPGAHVCGAQGMPNRSALDVMREAARTEGMPLFIDRSGFLALQPSTVRQNTSPAWTVDARDLEKDTGFQDDFAYVTNQATITPNGQAAQTVIGTVGAASQAKYGIYTNGGQQATASVSPVEAQSLGLSLIQLRADPSGRLAPVVVEAATLATQPGYGAAWYDAILATEISTPIRVANVPSQIGGGQMDAFVEGWTETVMAGLHTFAFSTSPIQGPTYQLDDAVLGHLDTDGSTLASSVTAGATSLSVSTTSSTGAAWTTNPADFPFDINLGGEQVTVAAIAPPPTGVDGTFETGVTGWTTTACTIAQSGAGAHSGSFGGLITATAAAAFSVSTAHFAVTAGATYQYTHWMKLASGAPIGEVSFLQWFNSGGAQIGATLVSSSGITPTSTWVSTTMTLTAPAGAVTAAIGVQATAAAIGNAIYVDDLTFVLMYGGGPQTFSPVIRSVNATQLALGAPADGTFETGTSGWTPTNGTFAASTAAAHSGSVSGLLTTTGSPVQTYVRPPNIPVTAGGMYTLTQWVLKGSGSPSIVAAIDWFDASGIYITTSSGSLLAGPSSWTQMTYTATAPGGAAFATFGPLMVSSPPAGTSMYLDDVTFAANVVASHPAGTDVRLSTPLTLAY